MEIRKAVEILERNIRVGSGNLRMEHKPTPHNVRLATEAILSKVKELCLGTYCQSCDVRTKNINIVACDECGTTKTNTNEI